MKIEILYKHTLRHLQTTIALTGFDQFKDPTQISGRSVNEIR